MSKESTEWFTTLAPNHQLPSNGSRQRLIALFVLFLLCSVLVSAQDLKIEDDDEVKEVKTTESKPVTLTDYSMPYDHLVRLEDGRKSIYHIAFILPLNVNKISPGDGKERAASMPGETREVLGFWEGVNIAFSKIRKMNSKYKFHIWDNMKDDSTTIRVIDQIDRLNVDAVIAPFHTKQALIVSQYCKEKKIPMFLAQNPSDVPAKDNPYSFKFQIPKNRLYYDYYKKITTDISETGTNLFFVYDGSNKAERKVSNYLKYMAEKDGTNRLRFIDYNTTIDFASIIDTNQNNLLMIAHYKSSEVNEILEKLSNYTSGKIRVYGHSLWSSNSKINLKYLSKLNAKIYTDYFQRNNPGLVSEIQERYKAMTGDHIVTDVFVGYDIAMYLANIIDKYNTKYPLSIEDYKYYGAVSNIHMKQTFSTQGKLLFHENSSKFLLHATKDGWVLEE